MKGYKIGIDPDSLEFVLIELEVPEEYPGVIIYKHEVEVYNGLFRGKSIWDSIFQFPEDDAYPNKIKQYRANVARVLNIQKIAFSNSPRISSAFSLYDENFYYHPGEIIYPDTFDPDPNAVCTNGIHFFDAFIDAVKFTDDGWARYRRGLLLPLPDNIWRSF